MTIITNLLVLKHLVKKKNHMASHKPVAIKKITLEYMNGTKLVVHESHTPHIGKLFFDSVNADNQIQWEVIEKGGWIGKLFHIIGGFFTI